MKPFCYTFIAFFVIILFLITYPSKAQTYLALPYDSTLDKSETRIGMWYSSDYYYMGRADSAKAPYLSPSIGYYHHSGVFVHTSLSYLTTPGEGRIDLITLTAGYEYYGKNFIAGISASEYFFSDYSYAIPSEMSTYLNAYGGYDLSVIMLYADASLGFSDYTDLFLGGEINRTFFFFRNRLRITPAVYINAGSQHYYNEYYIYRSTQTGEGKGKGNGKGGSGQAPPTTTTTTEVIESEKFQILDYEADLQVTYKIGKLRLYTSTTWTFPVNPATIVTDQGTYKEELKNGLYWSSGIRLTF